jgi:HAMP domain-containing protein
MALGIGTMLLLILTSIFSYFTIGRPMRALSVSMDELAGGNFAVVLPGLGRKDELGAVAGAVEKFKVVSEQKAREEAEAKIKQDQIAAQQRKADMVRLPIPSRPPSARSSKPCHPLRPNSKRPPAR